MKKYCIILLLLFFGFSLKAQSTFKYTSTNLNLRTEPNTSSKILIVLPAGTMVKMEEDCNCEWILVSYKENIGYVYSKYLTNNKTSTSLTTQNSNIKYYYNSAGEKVQSPTHYNSPPEGATALCNDGTYSFSRNRRGTCSSSRRSCKMAIIT